MSILQNSNAISAPAATGFYDYQIASSLRNSSGQNGTLKRTAGTPTSGTTFTFSYWVKRYDNATGSGDLNIFVTGTGGGTYVFWGFKNNNFQAEFTGGTYGDTRLITNAVYRDTSAFYHHVLRFDSTQSSATDRVRLYVNGTEVSYNSQTVTGAVNQNEDFDFINASGVVQAFGGLSGKGHGTEGADLQMADIIFCDGQSYGPDSFAETVNGVYKPVDPSSLAFGDNGYWLKMASGAIGTDSSSNGNNFTVANIAEHDVLLDSPTFNSDSNGGNFPTYNPLLKPPSGLALSEGNLKATLTSDDNGIMTNWQVPVTGKWYWEVDVDNIASDHGVYIGVMPANTDLTINQESNNLGLVYYSINGNSILKGTRSSYGATWTTGDIISIAVDRDADTLQFYKNGSGQGTISISTLDEEFFFYMGYTGGSGPCSTILNFGQDDGTFCGNVTAGGNSDGTGYGNFKYTVPTGFLALCSGNLPIVDAISPAETDDNFPQKLFSPLLYTGNGSSRSITGLGFQPDLVWLKNRDNNTGQKLFDSSRGVTKAMYPHNNDAEQTISGLSAFGSDGFSIGSTATGYNDNNEGFVAWNWRANGGTTSSNATGDITSTVQVDPSGHFSIVKYTANGSANQTWGHGLSAKPDFIILKKYSATASWVTYHSSLGATKYMYLNTDASVYTGSEIWNNTEPTTSLVTVDNNGNSNDPSGASFIAYCFANCEGYIKAGSYVGNGSTDGTFVYTGFKPAWVMVKNTSATEAWVVADNGRSPFNVVDEILKPNNSNAEATGSTYYCDFLSNGFKPRTTWEGWNQTNTFVYLAFASNPFQFATAR